MQFGKYEVISELGKGGMGVVYLAYDPVLQRQVAVKTIAQQNLDPKAEERFIREARAAAKLTHPNITHIYDLGREKDQLYMAMEFLEGRDLDEIIAGQLPMPLAQRLDIVRQICDGLHHAHRSGVFHRDVKPGNIKLLPDGSVKIMDFGLAFVKASSMTETGLTMGTPYYVAPEVLQGKKADALSDQFSLGLLFYELLTCRPAFFADTIMAILYKVINEEPRGFNAQFSAQHPGIEALIQKAIRKDPGERFSSLQEMSSYLRALHSELELSGVAPLEPVAVSDQPMQPDPSRWRLPTTRITPPATFPEKNGKGEKRWLVYGGAVLILLSGLLFLWQARRPAVNAPAGLLRFDVRPYALIERLVDLRTNKTLKLPETRPCTPFAISIAAGRYRLEYSYPAWGGKIRSREIEIIAGQTWSAYEQAFAGFAEKAAEKFLLPEINLAENKK